MVEIKIIKAAQAESELRRKMRLERRMMPDIRSVFSQMVGEYVDQLSAIGSVPQAIDFIDEWRTILRRQYRRVGKEFLNTQRQSKFYDIILETKQELTPEQSAELSAGFTAWARQYGIDQASFITQTNQSDYTEAFQKATAQAEEQFQETGVSLSTAAIAALAGIQLRRLFNGRVGAIANMQTQAPAEEAKKREAVSIARAEGTPTETIDKTWLTVGDERVRIAHILANGQSRPENAAFTVAGENLRYPGDNSLGASIGNVINCRCSALYS